MRELVWQARASLAGEPRTAKNKNATCQGLIVLAGRLGLKLLHVGSWARAGMCEWEWIRTLP